MARIGENARLRVRINETTTADVSGITKDSSLEEQAMLLWYTAHATIERNPAHRAHDDGVDGPLNMHSLVRTVFHLDNPDASRLSALIRQVFKKTGTARCTRLAKDGNDPEWWIANSMPDDIVTVAQWVAAHPHVAEAGNSTGNKAPQPTKAEERLTPHEVGEDRQPEPVTVTTPPKGSEVSAATMVEVEVEAAPDQQVKKKSTVPSLQDGASHEELMKHREAALKALRKVFKTHGPITAREARMLLVSEGFDLEISTVRDYVKILEEDGKIFSRAETTMERSLRQLRDRTAYWGKYSKLYSTRTHFAERDFAIDPKTGETYAYAEGMDQIEVPANRADPTVTLKHEDETLDPQARQVNAAAAEADVEMLPRAVEPREIPETLEHAIGSLRFHLDQVEKLTRGSLGLDDLRTMNELLEEENEKLRNEITDLKAQIERAKAAFN